MQLELQKGNLDLAHGVFRTAEGDRSLSAMERKVLDFLARQHRPVSQEELLQHV